MANVGFNDVQSRGKEIKYVHARLRILGNTTPANGTFSIVKGYGVATFARTGTGEYTITLQDKYQRLMSAQLTVLAATAVDLVAQLKSEDVAGAKTIVFNMNAGATPTDTANAVTQDVLVSLALQNTDAV